MSKKVCHFKKYFNIPEKLDKKLCHFKKYFNIPKKLDKLSMVTQIGLIILW